MVSVAALQDYAENVNYDGNGNILAYIRHGNPTVGYPTGPTAMDSMAYIYNTNNNQLNSVADGVSSSNYTTDIDNEVGDNYKYDKQGNMIFDSSQHLTTTWNVRNKVGTVYNDITKLLITFGYDAMGNRVMKKDSNLNNHKCYTLWYERDAQGNTLGIYKERNDSLWWQEADIYGSSRVGVYYADSLIYPKGHQVNKNDTFVMELWEGKRQYELTNHLGNVLTTISDKKLMLTSNATPNSGSRNAYGNIISYQPEVVSITDYYPFGMEEPGRNFSVSDDTDFRYGYNNKDKDNDIEGIGNTLDFGERMYDSRLGKWWSMDPDKEKYTSWSTYNADIDNPLFFNDPTGMGGKVTVETDKGRVISETVHTTVYVYSDVLDKSQLEDYAAKMQANLMQAANHPVEVDEKTGQAVCDPQGNPVHEDHATTKLNGDGKVIPVHYDITVKVAGEGDNPSGTPGEAQQQADDLKDKNGNLPEEDNFYRLFSGSGIASDQDHDVNADEGAASYTTGNVGCIDVDDDASKNGTVTLHEVLGHLFDDRFILGDAAAKPDYNTHEAYEPGACYQGVMTVSGDQSQRVWTTRDAGAANGDHPLNGGTGIGTVPIVGGQGTFGDNLNVSTIFHNANDQETGEKNVNK